MPEPAKHVRVTADTLDVAAGLLNDPPASLKVILSSSLVHTPANVIRAAIRMGLSALAAEREREREAERQATTHR